MLGFEKILDIKDTHDEKKEKRCVVGHATTPEINSLGIIMHCVDKSFFISHSFALTFIFRSQMGSDWV